LARTWMLLVYKIPNRPTAARVYVWRKLKKLNAILLHDAIWVLPATPQTREQLRWLASEILELNGETSVWESRLVFGDDDRLIQRFIDAVEPAYRKLLAAIKRKNADLAAISHDYQQIRTQDYFDSKVGRQVRKALIAAAGET
jgi:hypothetical protein